MHAAQSGDLVDPRSGRPLRLETVRTAADGEVFEGRLVADDGTAYPVHDGVADFVTGLPGADPDQGQTAASFGFKWDSWEDVEGSGAYREFRTWYITRYFDDEDAMVEFMAGRRRILDCGCGSGYSSSIYLTPSFAGELWAGVDISAAVHQARRRFADVPNTLFVRADMMAMPFPEGSFDTVVAEGTLHHTPSTRQALGAVARHLQPGGTILFYVYRKKSAIREFTDDYIRERVAPLSPEEAMQAVEPLTELGRILAELGIEIEVPDIPVLGITGGKYDLQRFIYWHVAKIYWNDQSNFEENNHTNFDWYHPRYAHRQTSDEVRAWCDELGLVVERLYEDEAGITVRATRSG
ncbi:MAG TPA: class I SAM-dependent methyltransferase [Acidimicrobiales bacterium]|nr:class I SAM-dependent methyltransferase [Acidimicrobiales bacterium]